MRSSRLLLSLGAPLGMMAAAPAFAQDSGVPTAEAGFDAHGFQLAPLDGDPRDPILVNRPGRFVQWEGYVGSIWEYASAPLVWVPADGDPQAVVDKIVAMNLSAGLAVHDRVRLQVGAPIFYASTGVDGANGASMGDLRLGGTVAIVRQQNLGFGLAVSPWVDVPTGNDEIYLGNSGLAGGASVGATQEFERITLSGDLGVQLNPQVDLVNVSGSDSLIAGAAVGYLFTDSFGATLEGRLLPAFTKSTEAWTTSPGEAILSGRKRWDNGLHVDLGGAKAITPGVGAANYRVFAGLGWGQLYSDRDTDRDGIIDREDACVNEPETANQYKDKDGCPDQLAQVDIRVTLDGQPFAGAELRVKGPESEQLVGRVDRSTHTGRPGDKWVGIASWGSCYGGRGKAEVVEGPNSIEVPLSRDREGTVSVTVKREGAPVADASVRVQSIKNEECGTNEVVRTDAEGKALVRLGAGEHVVIIEAADSAAVRRELTIADKDEKVISLSLAPAKAKLDAKRIVILDVVLFETGAATILPASFPLLDEVAGILLNNPQVKQVRVEGHTDDRGNDKMNLTLSQERAASVRAWLIQHGVAEDRLVSEGYGETRPIDSNKTKPGQAKNRRVEFNIVDPAPAP